MTIQRRAFIVDATMTTEGGYTPAVIFEGEPYVYPLNGRDNARPWVWGPTLEEAKEQCREANHDSGLTDEDVSNILASVWAACPHLERCAHGHSVDGVPKACPEGCKRPDVSAAVDNERK